MSDAYDKPLKWNSELPPPSLQWQGDYAVRIEPLTNTYRVCAVLAKSCITGRIATVVMAAKPTLSPTIPQVWAPDPAALDRAVRRAIAECEKGGAQ